MANCKGARAGAYGSGISERFSNAREVWDQNVKHSIRVATAWEIRQRMLQGETAP